MRLDGYIRVSRVGKREGPSFISPDVQRLRIEGLAAAGGHEIVHWHTDLDQSGTRADRPGFVEALARVERGDTEGIAVAKLDRFARSVSDCDAAVKRIRAANGVLLSAHEAIDTSGSVGKFVLTLLSAMAELEVDRIRENWEAAREAAVARGVHISSKVPTGYQRGKDGRLEVDEAAAKAVAEVFRSKGDGASWRQVGRILEDAGVATPYGSARWQAGSLRKLLSNRVYLGEARSGDFILRDAHPALISEAQWRAAQYAGVKSVGTGGGALLAGLIRCAGCGYILKADTMRDRKGVKRRLYRCRDHATGECTGRASVLGSVVEPWVVEQFFETFPQLQARAIETSDEIAAAERSVAEAERELVLYRDTSIAGVGQELWAEGMQARVAALEAAHLGLTKLRGAASSAQLPTAPEWRAMWPDLSVGDQREVLSGSIGAVFVRGCAQRNVPIDERAIVLWRGSEPDDLPGPGRRSAIRPFSWTDGDEVEGGIAAA